MKYAATYKTILLFVICFSFFYSCKTNNSISGNQSENKNLSTPKILFLNYSIQKTLNGKRAIQFINKKIVDGKVKQSSFEPIENGIDGDLVFTELNKKEKVISQGIIKNPLIKKMEYVDESKHFKTKVIDFDEMQFSIRLQLKNDTKYITISNFAKKEPLIKTQID